MVVRVEVEPALLAWARDRARIDFDLLLSRFPRLREWEAGASRPTLKQIEKYAHATHTPLGFLLLPEPPREVIPIPDFRTIGDQVVSRPSADLLDTVYACQQRQQWYYEFARANREEPVRFVGSVNLNASPSETALTIGETIGYRLADRRNLRTWSEALEMLRDRAEDAGVLVMISGIVASNTRRKLDPREFRGFALADELAPIVFVNGGDTKGAQIFTLAHELAHLWLGETGLSDTEPGSVPEHSVERWCNQVAAELLVPLDALRSELGDISDLTAEIERLARIFKVSTLVVLRRIHDAGRLSWNDFRTAYAEESSRVIALMSKRETAGGNFYNTTPVRVSKRFARALIASTLEGQTLYRDALRLLGFKKLSTLDGLGLVLGIW